jgi:hypothetical protein
MTVSCGDVSRKHPHTFVIERNGEHSTFYFLDPEYVMGKRDLFSPSVSNALKISFDQHDHLEVDAYRLQTDIATKKYNTIHGIFSTLHNNHDDAQMRDAIESERVLMGVHLDSQ